jgi:ubiquinone/menaquinone biosynthesis C-methylase UbiE
MHKSAELGDRFWDIEYEKKKEVWINNVPSPMPWFGITLKYKNASRILDIGCGCGRNSVYLGKMGFSVIGVDLNGIGIRKASDYSKMHSLSNVDFVRGSATEVPFKHDFFDGILCLFTLNLLAQKERKQVILEMQRVLNDRGALCLAEYVNEDFSEERLIALMKDFCIIGSWYEAIPLLSRSSPPLKTLCIIAEKQSDQAVESCWT